MHQINQPTKELLAKEVSRKDFLVLAMLATGSIFGLGSLIKLLTGKSLRHDSSVRNGYGLNGYGK